MRSASVPRTHDEAEPFRRPKGATGSSLMPTTNPTRGAARARAIAALTCAALSAAAAHAGTPTVARWAAPVSGSFYNAMNWVDGVAPVSGGEVLIDASGAAYVVDIPASNPPNLTRVTIDSADATLHLNNGLSSLGWTVQDLEIRLGTMQATRALMRSSPTGSFTIRQGAALKINEAGSIGAARGFLAIAGGIGLLANEGHMDFGRNSLLELAMRSGIKPQPMLHNRESGVIRSDAAFGILAASIVNEGVMEFHGRPTGENGAVAETILRGAGGTLGIPTLTTMSHSGLISLVDSDVLIFANLTSSGVFHVDPDSKLTIRSIGSTSTTVQFEPGSLFAGGGRTVVEATSIVGDLFAENELTVRGRFVGSVTNTGQTTLQGLNNGMLTGTVGSISSGGFLTLDLGSDFEFTGNLAARGGLSLSAQSNAATIQGDALLSGPVSLSNTSLRILGDLTLDSITQLSGSGTLTVDGDVVSNSGVSTAARIIVEGNAAFDGSVSTRRYTSIGATQVNGNLSASENLVLGDGSVIHGEIAATGFTINGDVSAASLRMNSFGGGLQLEGQLTITDDTQPLNLVRTRLVLPGLPSAEPDRIISDVILTRPPNFFTPSFQTTVRLSDDLARTLEVIGSMSIEGRLALTFFGGVTGAYLGQSFTLIHATDGLTGQFDPLTLPSLPNGLSLELVYDPHSLTLRVIPTPAAASVLALAGLAATRRRRSR